MYRLVSCCVKRHGVSRLLSAVRHGIAAGTAEHGNITRRALPLSSEKLGAMTDKDDILTFRFPFYASLNSCVPLCLFVPLCSSLFLFSFFYDGMTKRKDK
jgi:hypothetical protein